MRNSGLWFGSAPLGGQAKETFKHGGATNVLFLCFDPPVRFGSSRQFRGTWTEAWRLSTMPPMGVQTVPPPCPCGYANCVGTFADVLAFVGAESRQPSCTTCFALCVCVISLRPMPDTASCGQDTFS